MSEPTAVPPTIGDLITGEAKRDAIHIAVWPATSPERLSPGEHVGLLLARGADVVGRTSRTIGIVDPFLKGAVFPGERFFVFLYPQTITTLRHDWTHPLIDGGTAVKARARAVIEEEAGRAGITFEEIMAYAQSYLDHDEYAVQGGRWEGHSINEEPFWTAYEELTGVVVPPNKRYDFFSCSC